MPDAHDEWTAQTVLDGPEAVLAALGAHLGYSEWLLVDQLKLPALSLVLEKDKPVFL